MIVPMLKYSFLVYHAGYTDFLANLKKLGVLHVQQKKHEPTPEMQEMFRKFSETSRVIKSHETRRSKHETTLATIDFKDGEQVLNRVKTVESTLEQKKQQLALLEKEEKMVLPWGNFSPVLIEKLLSEGVNIRLLTCPVKEFMSHWETDTCVEIINEVNGVLHFVHVERGDNATSVTGLEKADEIRLPPRSLAILRDEIKATKDLVRSLDDELTALAYHGIPLIETYARELKSKLSEAYALHQTTSEVEGAVLLIEGWVPGTRVSELNNYLDEHKILSVSRKPREGEKVPVLLKNNRFNKVFEFIGNFYDLPDHKELDLTPFFAPFYMIFFGFALADIGYGITLLLGATFLKTRKPDWRSVMTLAQYLSVSTVVFGIITGTLFGISLSQANLPFIAGVQGYMLGPGELFYLALAMGVIQILLGMIIKVINITLTRGFSYAYSAIGWLILLVGGGGVHVLNILGAIDSETSKKVSIAVLVVSGVLIMLLNHPRRNIAINFLSGIWDTYGMVTGLLGDLMSYIRLFALCISSAILGSVFNIMALNMKPDVFILGPVVMVIILVVGHSITLFMSGLGAFVHPIRLTFVEFYKNAGFSGGGKKYVPFGIENNNIEHF